MNGDKQYSTLSLELPDAQMGQVVTRFPPEPSGYLHIGHAKAAFLNFLFAKKYEGKLIVRMDDTNPTKEKDEYTQAILQDLSTLGITANQYTHTSDYFDIILGYADKLIRSGDAYVDDTPVDQMRMERTSGIESASRHLTIDENLSRWQQMKQHTEFGQKCCLRAKIGMSHANKALRDPVLYRCNATPHQRTGQRFTLYPTYDFACPIVDSIEGVTHALRTNEYHDRNDQYYWILDHLQLRRPMIWDYSRINFVYTLMSKRKLQQLVDNRSVSGWDDPRFPTIRGLLRRGLTIEALRDYIILQGPSKNTLLLEWDKIWALNKQMIDPVAPRHVALSRENAVAVSLMNVSTTEKKSMPKHKKNPAVGTKTTVFSPAILIEGEDAKLLEVNEEITLMDWGNAFVRDIKRQPGSNNNNAITHVTMELHLEGDFKTTKKKLTWLADTSDKVSIQLVDYDHLITKKKLEEEDKLEDFLNNRTEFVTAAVADANVSLLKRGDILQFERRGYYICDGEARFICIPDGKVKSMSHLSTKPSVADAPPKKTAATPAIAAMYAMDSVYAADRTMSVASTDMYTMSSIYEGTMIPESAQEAPVAALGKLTLASVASTRPSDKDPAAIKAASSSNAAPADAAVVDDVQRLDMRVGYVLSVERHPDADSLYVEKIDVGESAPRTVISGLVKHVAVEDFQGKYVVLLCNLKPANMRGIRSEAMVLCAGTDDKSRVELLVPPAGSCPGDRVSARGFVPCPEDVLNPKKKIFEKVQPELKTDAALVATYRGVPLCTDKGVIVATTLGEASIS